MGVAPTSPGIPLMQATPRQPSATARSTRASHGSPAATSTRTRSPSRDTSIPRIAICKTSPGKPASPTTTLLPVPRTKIGSRAASAPESASRTSASRSRQAHRAALPPTRNVVRGASGTERREIIGAATEATRTE